MTPSTAFGVYFVQVCPHHILLFSLGLGVVNTGYILGALKSFREYVCCYQDGLRVPEYQSKGHRMLKSYGNKAPDTERISYLEDGFATRWGCPNDSGMKCPITLLTATTASKIRNSRQLSQAHGCCPAHLGKRCPHLFY